MAYLGDLWRLGFLIGLAGFGRDWGISGLDSQCLWWSGPRLVFFGVVWWGISVGLSPDRVSGVYTFMVL